MLTLEFPTVKLRIPAIVLAVLETVESNRPAFVKRNAKTLAAKVPKTRHSEPII
jgi:hypothetical protein